MTAPLKIASVVTVDSSQAKVGAKEAQTAIAGIGTSAEQSSTSIQRLIEASHGIGGTANQNIREWSGALAMAGRSADELRAKYSPLFAVISSYKQSLTEIRTLQAQGVLSTDEMTAAIQRQRQAALASIDAIKGRNSAQSAGGKNNNFAATNTMFQFQDILTSAIGGMPAATIGFQQGSQLAGGFAGMSLKEAGAAAVGGLAGLVSPISLVTIGLTTATAAAIQFLTNMESGAKKANKSLEDHEDFVRRLKAAYGEAAVAANTYYSESLKQLQQEQKERAKDLGSILKSGAADATKTVLNIPASDFDGKTKIIGDMVSALTRLQDTTKNGSPDLRSFIDSLIEIENLPATPTGIRKIIDEIRESAKEALAAQAALKPLVATYGSFLTEQQKAADMDSLAKFSAAQKVALQRGAASFSAEIAGLNARTTAEKVAAAKSAAASQYNDSETAPERQQRIENAGILAQKQAEKELADAKRERLRSIDQTISSETLELTLIGQTTSAIEAQRMEAQLLAEAKAAAEKAGGTVSEDELKRIKEASAEYGRLAEAIKATNILRDQANNLRQLELEIRLVGQSEAVRQRVLALAEAENQIRDQGITASSREAQQIRQNAVAMAEENLKLDRQQDAWNNVKSAGENAIDSIGEALRTGDWAGAAQSVLADLEKSVIQLGFENPIKNALLGTNYGTISDAGGLLSGLFGGSSASSLTTSSVGAMNVNASSVIINGGLSTGNLLGGIGGAANDNVGAAASAALTNKSGVASQMWNFFAGKGLKDFQIAGILGNAQAESAFRPTAAGDNGNALGLFQWNDRSQSLLNSIGGKGNLGNVQSQLEFAWKELQSSESSTLSRLLKTTNVRDATAAFAGFERPRGWSVGNPEGADNFTGRLSGAEAALSKFGSTTNNMSGVVGATTQNLGTLSNGLGGLGNSLQSAASGISSGGGGGIGSWLSKLFGFGSAFVANGAQATLAASGSIFGLFDSGGYTGDGARLQAAGVVHKGEVVWNQDDVARAGGWQTVEAMRLGRRGYASGGTGSGWTLSVANSNGQSGSSIIVNNYSGAKVSAEEKQDDKGQRQTVFTIADTVGEALTRKGGGAKRALTSDYGVRQRGRMR